VDKKLRATWSVEVAADFLPMLDSERVNLVNQMEVALHQSLQEARKAWLALPWYKKFYYRMYYIVWKVVRRIR